jgi:hypothetical protein
VRNVVVALVGCAACGFHVPSTGEAPMPPDGTQFADAPSIDGSKVGGDAAPNACHTTDASLRLCVEFDDPGLAMATTALDGSGLAHDPAIANMTVGTRTVPAQSQAAQLSSTSTITLATQADFDLQQFTLTAWMKRGASNPAQTQGVIDTGAQYALSIDTFGRVQCGVTHNGTTTYPGLAQTNGNEWDLVACTYDGAKLCGYAFPNGSASAQTTCNTFVQSLDTNAGYGTRIGRWAVPTSGSQFIGSLDQVRIYARALSEQELCTAAGLTGC